MKASNLKTLSWTGLCAGMLLLGSCQKDEKGILNPNPQEVFDLDQFENNLVSYVGNGPVGWAYVINQNGNAVRFGSFGFARNQIDGNVAMTLSKKINTASISKFITAIAVMQLLEKKQLTLENKIAGYLPVGWVKGPGVNELSFKDLLMHTSGLQSTNSNFSQTLCYDCIRDVIETGVVKAKTRDYLNVNFALFRILIPSLWKGMPDAPEINTLDDATTQQVYDQYIQKYIFQPLEIRGVTLTPESTSPTRYYSAQNKIEGGAGIDYTDWTAISGGGGYYMTTAQLAKLLAYFAHTEVLLSKEWRGKMKIYRAGFDDVSNLEEHGDYYGKNGSISNVSGQGVQGQMAIYPNGVEVIVMMNTQGVNFAQGNGIRSMLHTAYNNAWVIK